MKEYVTQNFYTTLGLDSIGWEWMEQRPIACAERWMNERAAEGFRLTSLTSDNPRHVVVVMEREAENTQSTDGGERMSHVCICGDCAVSAYVDHCKYELALVKIANDQGLRDAEALRWVARNALIEAGGAS